MRAGIQNDLIFSNFPGFRVSPYPVSSTGQACGLARNDSLVGRRYSLKGRGSDFPHRVCSEAVTSDY